MNVHEDVLKNGYYSYKLHMEGHLSFSVLLYLILDEIFSDSILDGILVQKLIHRS